VSPLAIGTIALKDWEFHDMANIKSQKKRILTNAKSAEINKSVKSEAKTRVKNAVKAAGTEDGGATLKLAQRRLDTAAAKGVIHPNAVARRKSRMMRKIAASA
jgi:small subunit ribosomal protein S20